jgi:hypothetical protein
MHSHRRRDAQLQQHAPSSSNSSSSNSSPTIRRWRWLALTLVISWNENLAIVNGTTAASSSSLRRTTTTGGADETLAELEREELLDTTVDNTSNTNPADAVPPALLDTTSSERPLGEATRPIETKHAEPAAAQQIKKEAAVPMPPQQQHPPKSDSSSSSLSQSNSTAATREQQFLDDDDRLFQQPRPSDIIYQKSPSSNVFLVPWVVAALGLIGMVFTAWQMADYPDGFYAGLCRMIFGSIQFLLYILTTPYRIICYYCCGRRTAGGHEPYGRISTMEYGYSTSKNNTNPALELS